MTSDKMYGPEVVALTLKVLMLEEIKRIKRDLVYGSVNRKELRWLCMIRREREAG